jgi:hypothetical protein
MTWDDLMREKPGVVKTTILWATGQLPNPAPGAVNFAQPRRVQAYLETHPDAEIVAKVGNWYLAEMGSSKWHPNTVIMQHQPEASAKLVVASAEPLKRGLQPGSMFWRVFLTTLLDPFGNLGRRVG